MGEANGAFCGRRICPEKKTVQERRGLRSRGHSTMSEVRSRHVSRFVRHFLRTSIVGVGGKGKCAGGLMCEGGRREAAEDETKVDRPHRKGLRR